MKTLALVLLTALCWFSLISRVSADTDQQARNEIAQINYRLNNLDHHARNAGAGGALFLAGAFCALWAQNTGRSAWLWFFLGLFFNVITVIVLLVKNSNERTNKRRDFDLNQFREQ
jgi:hypothetical protein